ncbi:uncharacterized protein LY89DRAFT_713453 [Mollisia scopiformis]|uniref:Uncharacterized protein n=1 Tax=Mollisia scopiformis TaxID=149040 RepID=A0A194XWX4_MOLSC|nr:uncharacterized protein LY89DRAFT_713453 [Mollisia scopiformis]KUJ24656.1 hypothetical protein LY89DRAFT_713453 [Mollisia scopiformis]
MSFLERGGENIVPLLELRNKMDSSTTDKKERPRSATTMSILAPEKRRISPRFIGVLKRAVPLLVHVPPMVISVGVLTLTFRQAFWGPPGDNTNAVLNSLQFAAQLHTSLIAVSLAAILLHYVHTCLRASSGAPLGFLSSNFQLHSLTYVLSSEFRALGYRYVLIFFPLFLLGMLAGPASAITMLPRLQFWSINKLWTGTGNLDFRVFIGANETMLYPSVLTAGNSPAECAGLNASLLGECPGYGMKYWLQQDDLFPIYQGPAQINKSIEETNSFGEPFLRYMVGQTSFVNQGNQDVYLTSTLSKFLASALVGYGNVLYEIGVQAQQIFGEQTNDVTIQSEDTSLLARYDLSFAGGGKTVSTRKPLVEVECAGYAPNATSLTLQHSRMVWPPFTSDPIDSADWEVQASDYSSLSSDLNSTVVNSSFIDISQFGTVAPSLGAFFATPAIFATSSFSAPRSGNLSLFTCTIDARWMPTTAFWDSSSGTAAVFDSNPNPNAAIGVDADLSGLHPYALDTVSITPSFSSLLDVPFSDSIIDPQPTNRTILDTLGQKCLDSNTFINSTSGTRLFNQGTVMSLTSCLEVALSIYLADAMSRLQDSIPIYLVASGHLTDLASGEGFPEDVYYVQDFYAEFPGSTEMIVNQTTGQSQLAEAKYQVLGISLQDFEDDSRFLEMKFAASRWGYGYGFQESRLIFVGVVVLLLHVVLCLGFMGWVLVMGDRGRAWESIGELVVVGMKSGALGGKDAVEEEREGKKWKDRYVVEEVVIGGESSGIEGKKEMVLRKVGKREKDEDYDSFSHAQWEPR